MDVSPNPKNLIDEIDVGHAPGDQAINLLQHSIDIPLAILIPEQRLVAERTGPWTAAGKLNLSSPAFASKNVVPVKMTLYLVIVKTQGAKVSHVGHCTRECDVFSIDRLPATSLNGRPRCVSEFWQDLIRFSAKNDVAIKFSESGGRRRRSMGSDRDLNGSALQIFEPLPRNPQFGRGTSPKQVRRRSGNNQEVRHEFCKLCSHFRQSQAIGMRID